MTLKDTFKHLRELLVHISEDLDKAEGGNKAASQRVRTGTVKLEKLAKVYRKESIKAEKLTVKKGARKPAAPKAGAAKKTAAKPVAPKAKGKAVAVKGSAQKTIGKPHALSYKKATARLPAKKRS